MGAEIENETQSIRPKENTAMRALTITALVLMVIGAINWGLIGLFGFNLVTALFGNTFLTPLVYILVGLAGIYGIWMVSRLASRTDDICVPGHGARAPMRT